MPLSEQEMADLEKLKAARLRLISGEGIAKVSTNGRSVEYSQANMSLLEREISALQGRCAPRRGRAIGFRL